MSLTRAERATTINFDEESDTAHVVTYSKPLIKQYESHGQAKKVREYPEGGVYFTIPKKYVMKPRAERKMSEAQRQAVGERMRRYHAGKNGD